jgi:hypothetical protein
VNQGKPHKTTEMKNLTNQLKREDKHSLFYICVAISPYSVVSADGYTKQELLDKVLKLIEDEKNMERLLNLETYKIHKQLNDIAKANIEKLEKQLKLYEGCLLSHNTVVVFPDTLLTVNSNGINNSVIPSLFEPERAKELSNSLTNGRGDKPTTMNFKAYYKAMIEQQQTFLINN